MSVVADTSPSNTPNQPNQHAGNILIRPHPPPAPSGWAVWDWARRWGRWTQEAVGLSPNFQVVLLDHGMYRRLSEVRGVDETGGMGGWGGSLPGWLT